MKILKYFLFIISAIITVGIIYFLLGLLFSYAIIFYSGLTSFWKIVFWIFGGISILLFTYSILYSITSLLTNAIMKLSPNSNFALWIITILAGYFSISGIIGIWNDGFNWIALVYSILLIFLSTFFISTANKYNKQNNFDKWKLENETPFEKNLRGLEESFLKNASNKEREEYFKGKND
ncbi:hypothetical protein BFP77_15960 [Maribacter sp. 4U21]|uniref:hypothetical protein n=1 Tax=Maribacter sp. 4U21 TaxID=1889779 RepID=UPI000C1505BC|nr:hypothetical protein [Maribacter sp. 4U21]PIB23801.1 hypothetical protein BFP77_15960 [Maribacter sp. 4U21]